MDLSFTNASKKRPLELSEEALAHESGAAFPSESAPPKGVEVSVADRRAGDALTGPREARSFLGTWAQEAGPKTHRVSTGISDLDDLIEGGFPANKSCLIVGEPGTGKTIFATQFVLSGLANGEKAVFVAVDDKPADIIEQAASLGWDLAPYLDKRQLLILDASPFFSQRAGASRERGIDVAKTVSDLGSYVKRMGASRVVIDPVGPLITPSEPGARLRENARLLVRSFQDTLETTNVFTMYAFATADVSVDGEESPFAGVIDLRLSRRGKGLARTLLVRKMRGTALDLVEHNINIMAGRGVVMGPKIPEPLRDLPQKPSVFREWRID